MLFLRVSDDEEDGGGLDDAGGLLETGGSTESVGGGDPAAA